MCVYVCVYVAVVGRLVPVFVRFRKSESQQVDSGPERSSHHRKGQDLAGDLCQ